MSSAKATKFNQQNYKIRLKTDKQRSETGLSQTSPRFYLLTVVVTDNFAQIEKIFLISHVAARLNFSIMNLGKIGSFLKDFIS